MLQNAHQISDIKFVPYDISKDEDYMNERQLAHFKQILLKWRQALPQNINNTVGQLQLSRW